MKLVGTSAEGSWSEWYSEIGYDEKRSRGWRSARSRDKLNCLIPALAPFRYSSFGSRPINHVNNIAQELLVGNTICCIGWELHFRLKMSRQPAEKLNPRHRIKLAAPKQRLQNHRCL